MPSERWRTRSDLSAAGCDAVVVAPGRGSRAQVSPASLALLIQERVPDLEAILTVTTWDRSVIALQADLLGAHAFGLRHVICRTGTPPFQADYPNVAGIWDIDGLGSSQMLHGLNQGRDHTVRRLAARPTSSIGARIHPAADDFERQVGTVRAKIAAGASYLVTPPVYDIDALARLLDAAEAGDLPGAARRDAAPRFPPRRVPPARGAGYGRAGGAACSGCGRPASVAPRSDWRSRWSYWRRRGRAATSTAWSSRRPAGQRSR